ncbi:MAG TPA: hypothetical protein VNW46_12380 [Gemmatimonadaceae bacterium]|nr:hypothetical protein [Gemmatimonadaceae bacterium]
MRTILTPISGLVVLTIACSASPKSTSDAAPAAPAAPPATAPAPAPTNYHLLNRISLGKADGWDYLTIDPATRRLYISHEHDVLVVDADSGRIVGTIHKTAGVHGIALAPELGRGFISDGDANTVTIFEPATLKVIGTTKVTGHDPDAIVYDSVTRRVFTMNGKGNNTTAIDATTGAVVGTIPLGGAPEFAVADGRGRIYVNIESTSELVAFDAHTLAPVGRWPLAPCATPSGLAIDRATRRLFVGCRSHVMAIVDADSGKVLTTFPIGDHVDADAFDPATGLAFASTGEGTLAIVHEDDANTFHAAQTVPTKPRAKTMALDLSTHRVYTVTQDGADFVLLVYAP